MEHIYEIVLDGDCLNDYMRGRISGMVYILTRKPDKGFPWKTRMDDNRWIATTQCSEETFNEIVETINRVYWGAIVETRQVS